jgi:dTDP-glucose 4,6-dehydratase
MKRILVTGGAGFIGSNFIRYLLSNLEDLHITNLDALTYAGSLENLAGITADERYHFVKGDICDAQFIQQVVSGNQFDTVVHFAAETHVDRSIHGPGQFIESNIVGTFNLLEAAKKEWLVNAPIPLNECRFHHISTDEVFGSLKNNDPAWTEDSPYDPHSPYAASKASSDHLVRAYYHTYQLPISITNCSNNYGPYQFPEKFIPLMILNALDGREIPIYGDGKQIRDWLYVTDHCEAIWRVLSSGKVGNTYNIGGNCQPTNLEIARLVCSILDQLFPGGKNFPHEKLLKFVKDRPGHDRRYAMDTSKIRHGLNWKPSVSLEEGMMKTVEWYLYHPEWVDAIRRQSQYLKWMKTNYSDR